MSSIPVMPYFAVCRGKLVPAIFQEILGGSLTLTAKIGVTDGTSCQNGDSKLLLKFSLPLKTTSLAPLAQSDENPHAAVHFQNRRRRATPQFALHASVAAVGRSEELLSIAVGATGIFSVRTPWTNTARNGCNDCRPYTKAVGLPLLTIVGSAEPKFFS